MQAINIDEITSTNEYALNLLNDRKIRPPVAIFADYQTKGKGQTNNSWHAERGQNILCSFVVKPKIEPEKQFILLQTIALSVAYCLKEYTPNINIKWANDIYHQDKKIAGILIENRINTRQIEHSIIGVGINVNQTQFPDYLPNPTSLALILGKKLDLDELKQKLTKHIEQGIENIKSDTQKIQQQYLKHLYKYKQKALFKDKNETFVGRIIGTSEYGYLLVQNIRTNRTQEYDIKQIKYL